MTKILVLVMGGTITQHSDSTGSSAPGFDVRTLTPAVADLTVDVSFESLMSVGSKDIEPRHWTLAATEIARRWDGDEPPDGIVILHGTDTLHFTSAALSFLLGAARTPVIMTGSMRPGGDQGSDSIANLRAAVVAAADSRLRGVHVVFSADRSCTRAAIFSGVNVRKSHTVEVDAFSAYESRPLGYIEADRVHLEERRSSSPREEEARTVFLEDLTARVPILPHSPGLVPEALSRVLEVSEGVVIAGTGVGHVSQRLLDILASYPGPVVMTTQVAMGGEHLGAYAGDRRTLDLPNVVRGRSMSSETAQAKLIWALAAAPDRVIDQMNQNVCGELDSD